MDTLQESLEDAQVFALAVWEGHCEEINLYEITEEVLTLSLSPEESARSLGEVN